MLVRKKPFKAQLLHPCFERTTMTPNSIERAGECGA